MPSSILTPILRFCPARGSWSDSARATSSLKKKLRDDRRGGVGVGDQEEVAVVERDQAGIRNELRQDPAVHEWHERIIGPRHHQRWLRKEAKPRQAGPSQA